MDEFENRIIRGIHTSRYVASWMHAYSMFLFRNFRSWLESLIINDDKLSEDEIRFIVNFANNGKLELMENAKKFKIGLMMKEFEEPKEYEMIPEAKEYHDPNERFSDKRKERAAQRLSKEIIRLTEEYSDYIFDDDFGDRVGTIVEPKIKQIERRNHNGKS